MRFYWAGIQGVANLSPEDIYLPSPSVNTNTASDSLDIHRNPSTDDV